MLFYQPIFQRQGLHFRVAHDEIEVVNAARHAGGFYVVGTVEILGHPISEGAGFSHVNHLTRDRVHNIHTRYPGKGRRLGAQMAQYRFTLRRMHPRFHTALPKVKVAKSISYPLFAINL